MGVIIEIVVWKMKLVPGVVKMVITKVKIMGL